MATAPFYTVEGEPNGEVELCEALFAQPVRVDLVHRAVLTEEWNRRQGTHSTKSRAAVRGGGRKPYRQKGTGRARQGSTRAPQYRHGGVAHGPRPQEHEKKLPQKVRRAAFRSALSAKAADGALRVLEALSVPEISTRRFAAFLEKLQPGARAVLVLAERDDNAFLSANNLPNIRVVVLPGLSTRAVVQADTLIFTRDAVARLEELYAS